MLLSIFGETQLFSQQAYFFENDHNTLSSVQWAFFKGFINFPGDSDGKESACNAGDLGSIPGLGRSYGEGHGNPLQYSCLENPHGQRSLAVGYSPWGHKESDTTERLSKIYIFTCIYTKYIY